MPGFSLSRRLLEGITASVIAAFVAPVVAWVLGVLLLWETFRVLWNTLHWWEMIAPVVLFVSGWMVAIALWLRGNKRTLVIHYAGYGLGEGKYVDVTNCVLGYLKDNKIDVPVSNTTFNFDPFPGIKKHVCVIYSFGRKHRETVFRHEGDQLKLPEN